MITKKTRITALEIIKHNFILFFVELALRFRGGILLFINTPICDFYIIFQFLSHFNQLYYKTVLIKTFFMTTSPFHKLFCKNPLSLK